MSGFSDGERNILPRALTGRVDVKSILMGIYFIDNHSHMGNSYSSGAIAGIVIGCFAGVALAVSLSIFFCYYRRRRSSYAASNSLDLEAGLTEGGPSMLPISSHATSDREWNEPSARVESQDDVKKKKKIKGIRVKGKSRSFFGLGLGAKEDDLKPSAHFAAAEDVEMHQISTVKGSSQVAPPAGMVIGRGGDDSQDIEDRPSHASAPESKGKTMLQRWLDTLPLSMESGDQPSGEASSSQPPAEMATRLLIASDMQWSAVASFSPSKSNNMSLSHLFNKLSKGSRPKGISFHTLPPSRPQSMVAASSVGGEGSVITTRSRLPPPAAPSPLLRLTIPLEDGTIDEVTTQLSNDPRATASSGTGGGGVAFSRITLTLPSPPSRRPSLFRLDEEQGGEERETGGRSLTSPHTNVSSFHRSSSYVSLGSNWLAAPPAAISKK